jgi:glutamine transport system permease protein
VVQVANRRLLANLARSGGNTGSPDDRSENGTVTNDKYRGIRFVWSVSRRILISAAIVLIAVATLYFLGTQGLYNLSFVAKNFPAFLHGAEYTLGLIAIVIPIGFGAGFAFGWGRTSQRWLMRSVSTAYIEFFRSMPPVVLIVFAGLITILVVAKNPFLAARIEDVGGFAISMSLLALSLHSGSYQAEIIRAGINSVPAGQHDAAAAIGLTRGQIVRYVVLPQMFRISLPALSNEFASVIKDTSLLSVIGAVDLTFQGKNLASNTAFQGHLGDLSLIWLVVAFIYLLMTLLVSRTLQAIERRYRVPGLEAAQL